jgi:hypothetical protein
LILDEYLRQSSDEKIKQLALQLKKMQKDDKFVRNHLINEIKSVLINFRSLHLRHLQFFEENQLVGLTQLAFKGETEHRNLRYNFASLGLLFEETMPDDIQEMIRENMRERVVRTFSGFKEHTAPSLFLKLVLFLELIRKDKVSLNDKRNEKNFAKMLQKLHLKPDGESDLKTLIKYMLKKELAVHENKRFILNEGNFSLWKKRSQVENLQDFYSDIISRSSVKYYLKSIAEIQRSPEEWVDIDYLPLFIREYDVTRDLGLARLTTQEGKHFVQLTPEGWVLTKGSMAPSWKDRNIIVSADFEVFVPHTYDPYVALEISRFCRLKENDYFLVYEIDDFSGLNSLVKNEFESFSSILFEFSRHLPNVVNYEIKSALNRLRSA